MMMALFASCLLLPSPTSEGSHLLHLPAPDLAEVKNFCRTAKDQVH
jgi:hypothetical protein